MSRLLRLSSILLATVVLALPADHFARKRPDFSASIRPLSWTSPPQISFGGMTIVDNDPDDAVVQNHCTAWAYRLPNDPTTVHWITAAHCVLNEETNKPEEHDYQIDGQYVWIEAFLPAQDIASLGGGPDAPGLKLAPRGPDVLDPIVVRGFPLGWDAIISTLGYTAALNVHFQDDEPGINYDIYNVTAAPGNSGSPVFNNLDEVIGVLQIGWGRSFSPMSGGSPTMNLRIFMNLIPRG